jgi:hypothetical protein
MIIPATADLALPTEDRLGVLTTTLPVVLTAPQVTLDGARVATIAEVWSAEPWPNHGWDTSIHFFDGTERTLNWMALLDALNFCFWGDPPRPREIEGRAESMPLGDLAPIDPTTIPRWQVRWHDTWYGGYNALAVALRRAQEEGLPLWDAGFLARIDADTLRHILRTDPDENGVAVPIPLFAARLANTHEMGRVLLEQYEGQFARVIEAAQRDAVALALRMADEFPSFHDVARWENEGGQEVRILKRAQILVSDIASAFDGKEWGDFTQLDALTAFADYKVPQLLRRLGILTYAPELAAKLDRLEAIPAGSADEVAIRAATIWGVEWLRRALAAQGMRVNANAIDYRLWLAGQQSHANDRPYHRTRTIYY